MIKKELPNDINLEEIREMRHTDKSELRGSEEIKKYAEARSVLRQQIKGLLDSGVSRLQAAEILRTEQTLAEAFGVINRWEKGGSYLKRKEASHGQVELNADDFTEMPLSPRGVIRAAALAEQLYDKLDDNSAVVWVGSGQPRSEYTLDVATARFDKLLAKNTDSDNPSKDIISLRLESQKGLGDVNPPESLLVDLRKIVKERTGQSTKTIIGGKELMRIWADELTEYQQKTGMMKATAETQLPKESYDTPFSVAQKADKALETILDNLPKDKIGDRKLVVIAVTHSGPLWQKKKDAGFADAYPMPGEYGGYTYNSLTKQWSVEFNRVKLPGEKDDVLG